MHTAAQRRGSECELVQQLRRGAWCEVRHGGSYHVTNFLAYDSQHFPTARLLITPGGFSLTLTEDVLKG